ncbi:Teichoic acid export ATP-binding protein tagH [Streptococcus pyogenes]|nr:Teichoic acid export ATP-binding protein tagH [Streptococcus pyogenes]
MINREIAVKVQHVSKTFKLPTEATKSFRTTLVNRLRGIKGFTEQHVLKDINFDVYKGDFFGIVGRNGSGKSTLLKIISQIYVPEKGTGYSRWEDGFFYRAWSGIQSRINRTRKRLYERRHAGIYQRRS